MWPAAPRTTRSARPFASSPRKYHPDTNSGDKAAEEKFKEANEAHETLSDPDKRKQYDEMLRLGVLGSRADGDPRPGGSQGFDPRMFQRADQIFQMGNFSDTLTNLFDGMGPNGWRGTDPQADATISFDHPTE